MSELLQIIKESMKERKMSIKELAERVGVSRPNLTNNINGKTDMLLSTFEKIVSVLEIDINTQKKSDYEHLNLKVNRLNDRLIDKDTRVKYLEILLQSVQKAMKNEDIAKAIVNTPELKEDPLLKQVMELFKEV